jgi:hypothetical protein
LTTATEPFLTGKPGHQAGEVTPVAAEASALAIRQQADI